MNRVSASTRDLLLFVALLMGAGVGAILYALTERLTMAAGGAGIGVVIGVLYAVTLGWDLARRAITKQPQPEGDEWMRTAPRTLARLPDGWSRADYVYYMTAVLEGDRRPSQQHAATFGHDRDKLNALVEWLHGRGWYEYTNGVDNRNGGEFVADDETILRGV